MRRALFVCCLLTLAACQCGNPKTTNTAPDGGGGDGGCVALVGACAATADCCSGLSCDNGSCRTPSTSQCGLNSILCSGTCAVVLTDPSNCGACGRACASGQVCNNGACVAPSSCPQGTTACAGSCVDLQSSNTYCGTCTTTSACPAGQGCSAGSCVPTVPLDGGTVSCPGGGSPVVVASDAGTYCAGNIAQVTFRWALCSCGTMQTSSAFSTDAFDSTGSGVDAGLLGAGVGANGAFTASSAFDIGGTGWFGGTSGLTVSSLSQVRQELHVNGQCQGGGSRVGANAYVNGNVSSLAVGGTLFVPAPGSVGGGVTAGGGTVFGPVSVPPPCDCSPSQLIDVAGIVRDGQLRNDNAQIGLSASVFETTGGRRLDLPCGRYYLTRITPNATITIAVHGRTAIFVGGDVTLGSELNLAVDANAELDLFVGGNLTVTSPTRLGSTLVPAQLRVYVAGNTVSMTSNALLGGNFYMPSALYRPTSGVDIYGSVFCGSFDATSEFRMHYDRAILSSGRACPPPGESPDGGPAPDGGSGCTSCRDCGNQACLNGSCGACTVSEQCCAPLRCVSGQCVIPIIN